MYSYEWTYNECMYKAAVAFLSSYKSVITPCLKCHASCEHWNMRVHFGAFWVLLSVLHARSAFIAFSCICAGTCHRNEWHIFKRPDDFVWWLSTNAVTTILGHTSRPFLSFPLKNFVIPCSTLNARHARVKFAVAFVIPCIVLPCENCCINCCKMAWQKLLYKCMVDFWSKETLEMC